MLAGLQSQNRGGWSWHIWNSFGRGQSSNALCFSCFQTYLAMQAVAGEGRGQPFWVPWASLQGKPYLSRWVFLYISSVTWKVEIITWKFKKKGRKKGTREGRVQRGECATTERSLARNQETKCSWTQSSAWVNLRAKNTIQWSKKKKKKGLSLCRVTPRDHAHTTFTFLRNPCTFCLHWFQECRGLSWSKGNYSWWKDLWGSAETEQDLCRPGHHPPWPAASCCHCEMRPPSQKGQGHLGCSAALRGETRVGGEIVSLLKVPAMLSRADHIGCSCLQA